MSDLFKENALARLPAALRSTALQGVIDARQGSQRKPGEDWVINDPVLINRVLDQAIGLRSKGIIRGEGFSGHSRFVILKRFAGELSVAHLSVLSDAWCTPGQRSEMLIPTAFGAIVFEIEGCLFEDKVLMRVRKPARIVMARRRNLGSYATGRQILQMPGLAQARATCPELTPA